MRIEGTSLPVTIVLETEVDVVQVLDLLEENRIGPSDHPIANHLNKVIAPKDQPALFDAPPPIPAPPIDPIFPINLVQWTKGQEAGWRGDELLNERDYSQDYMLGYEQGLSSRESYRAWKAIEQAKLRAAGD